MGALLFSYLRVTNVKFIKEKNSLITAVSKMTWMRHSIRFFVFSLLYSKDISHVYLSMLDFNDLCKFSNIFINNITKEIQ